NATSLDFDDFIWQTDINHEPANFHFGLTDATAVLPLQRFVEVGLIQLTNGGHKPYGIRYAGSIDTNRADF
ncbi:MAG: hypothetical protein V3S41_08925, partial [Spirochaetia bacterium]